MARKAVEKNGGGWAHCGLEPVLLPRVTLTAAVAFRKHQTLIQIKYIVIQPTQKKIKNNV